MKNEKKSYSKEKKVFEVKCNCFLSKEFWVKTLWFYLRISF